MTFPAAASLPLLDVMLVFPLFVGALAADPMMMMKMMPMPPPLWQSLQNYSAVLRNTSYTRSTMNITIFMPPQQRVDLALFLGSEIYEADDLADHFPNVKVDMVMRLFVYCLLF